MSEPEALTGRLRDSIQARKEVHPVEFRVCHLEKKLPDIERALKGVIWNENLCLGFVRETEKEIKAMCDTITAQNEMIADLKAALGSVQADLVAAMERLDKAAAWLKTKGMQ